MFAPLHKEGGLFHARALAHTKKNSEKKKREKREKNDEKMKKRRKRKIFCAKPEG